MLPSRTAFVGVTLSCLALTACGQAGTPTESSSSSAAAVTITDAAGRTVELPAVPQRIVFGEQRQAYASMVLDKEDPTRHVVAWGSDMEKAAPDMYARLAEAHPAVADIPKVGSLAQGDLTVESLLSHKPDVYVMTLDSMRAAEKNGLLAQFDKAGLTYVVTDFRVDPAKNTDVSMRAIGALLGRGDKAEEFLTYYHGVVDPVVQKAESATNRPTSFAWRAPGVKACCSTWGDVNFGQMLTRAGGTNLGTKHLPGEEGDLTPEQVLAAQPDVVVATGGAWSKQKLDDKAKTSYLALGYDVTQKEANASLASLRKQPGFDQLEAFDTGRVHGVYHQFYDAPYNFVAYQAFAKWQHPELFPDVDPQKTWADFSEKFMPFPAEGTVVSSLR
ncbi:ABC transporter substrate-binding protein [Mobilicoccus pelagius]|uniref:Putative iron-siderophore ABC transporter substrate-binding protein n=1 Tax=Mobilicoccus pelagius NBRC 104925 TaxID=1089455 RepID=H5UMW3_9MICO|nr:ABC transporter substrate-binding protein [Mobilicoccus pelagius]GAB47071.1 putative iron-siderophore ABC transporter substrate-binding protein [Mobilicoccus pelagius NBRC 104925]